MDFGSAIKLIKKGYRLKRHNWGGYWMIPGGVHVDWYPKYQSNDIDGCTQTINMNEMIVAKLKDGKGYAPAQPYMEDMLSDDWEVAGNNAENDNPTQPYLNDMLSDDDWGVEGDDTEDTTASTNSTNSMKQYVNFRVYDKIIRTTLQIRSIEFDTDGNAIFIEATDKNGHFSENEVEGDFSRFIFQEYSGLKDKSGTKIYEGDVVEFNSITSPKEKGEGTVWRNHSTFMVGSHPLNLSYELTYLYNYQESLDTK